MRARILLLLLTAAAVVGCGPKPTTPTGERGDGPVSLDGLWTVTNVEGPPGEPGPKDDDLNKVVIMVKGNLITVRRKDAPVEQYLTFEVDEKANPKTITFTESDEKGDTSPVKRTTYHSVPRGQPAPPLTEDLEPRLKVKGIYAIDGDTVKIAIGPAPNARAPTGFVPKAPATKWTLSGTLSDGGAKKGTVPDAKPAEISPTFVFHLKRVKETPEWATKPPQPAEPTVKAPSTAPRPTGK